MTVAQLVEGISSPVTGVRRRADVDLAQLLEVAEEAALSTAELLLQADPRRRVARDRIDAELVTDLDRVAEINIRETILRRRAADGFIGEELGSGPGHHAVEWILDPIDGTINYAAGLPSWAISIAARLAGQVKVGVVCAPQLGSTFSALRGSGAWLNGVALATRRPRASSLEDAVVATGFGRGLSRRLSQLDQLQRVLAVARDVRTHGAASLELCGVATGEIDAYYESGLRPWDVAAGALIASEAGIDVSGSPWSGEGTLVAAPSALSTPLRRLLTADASAARRAARGSA